MVPSASEAEAEIETVAFLKKLEPPLGELILAVGALLVIETETGDEVAVVPSLSVETADKEWLPKPAPVEFQLNENGEVKSSPNLVAPS